MQEGEERPGGRDFPAGRAAPAQTMAAEKPGSVRKRPKTARRTIKTPSRTANRLPVRAWASYVPVKFSQLTGPMALFPKDSGGTADPAPSGCRTRRPDREQSDRRRSAYLDPAC
jgi:hypothetical protein